MILKKPQMHEMKKWEVLSVSVPLTVLTEEPDLRRRWHVAGLPQKPELLASTGISHSIGSDEMYSL